MGRILHVLIVEDSENDALLLLRELRKGGYQPEYKRVDTEIAMIEALEKDKWDIIISDYSMPQFNGIAALKISQKYKPDLPFIIVSGTIGEDVAVEAMKAGAHDYLMKGNLERLTPAIERELHDARIRREHKLSLIKLRQTEGIVKSSHDMMALLNKDFVYLYANDAYLKAFGKTRDQLLGQSAPDVFGEVVFKTTIKPYADRCFEGKKARYQEWFDFPTLGHRYLDVAYTPYIGETNVVNEFVVIARDITEFKQTQEALLESEKRLIEAQHIAKMGDFTWDVETGEVTWSDELFDLLQYDKSEEIDYATVNEQIHHPDDLKRVTQWLKDCIASGKGELAQNEYRLIRKDGKILYVNTVGVIARQEGKSTKVFATLQDVTERKLAEEALWESEERYREILEKLLVGVYQVTLDGKPIFANQRMTEMLGYASSEELIATGSFAEFYARPEERHKVVDEIMSKGFVNKEVEFKRIDGQSIWIKLNTRKTTNKEGVIILEGLMEDVTEKRKLRDKLHRAQKMESLGLMAGGIAHDLNNILSGIVSYPELLLLDIPVDSPMRKPMETIKKSGMRAVDVVSDLVTIARGVATVKEVLNLNTIVTEYLESAEHQELESTHSFIDFKVELNPDLLNLNGSSAHINKTLMNLVINASEAIEGTGTVTISTTNRYLDEPLTGYEDVRIGEYAVLSVLDDGSGISSEDLEKIFEPFYTKKVMGRSGTGLGLAVVWNSVQDHNGYIDVKSSEEGTVFELYFRVTRDPIAEDTGDVPAAEYQGHGEIILVVDDEENQREIACGILTKLGYIAEAVSSGEEAIEYMKENTVDLIVLDMVMPKGINGRETYQQITKIRPGQKAIIATGYTKTKEVDIAQELGAGKYIKKPYTLEKIGVAVKEELEK